MGSAKASGQVLKTGASDLKPTFAPQEKYGSFERKVVLERLIWYLGYSPARRFLLLPKSKSIIRYPYHG